MTGADELALLLFFGGLAFATSGRAAERTAEPPPRPRIPSTHSSSSGDAGLVPPLAAPLRSVTPHGAFGAPRYRDGQLDHYHQGLDLAARPGESVLAVGAGVTVPILDPGLCGVGVKLHLDDGRSAVYCDLGTATSAGRQVAAGDVVGTVGKRGFIHIAIRQGLAGPFVDPTQLIPHAEISNV